MNDFTGLSVFKSNNLYIKLYRLSIIEYGPIHFGSNFFFFLISTFSILENWSRILPSVMMAFRISPSTQSTQFSPYFLLFGKEMPLPIDTWKQFLKENFVLCQTQGFYKPRT
jgi:hypothetical protein